MEEDWIPDRATYWPHRTEMIFQGGQFGIDLP